MKAKRIFFDLDETLINSYDPASREWDGADFNFFLESGENYGVYVRPEAEGIIQFAKIAVGPDNVFILTKSRAEYAKKVVQMAKLGVRWANIWDRDILKHVASYVDYPGKDGLNILIDDLPLDHKNTIEKMNFLKIGKENVLIVPPFDKRIKGPQKDIYYLVEEFILKKCLDV